MRISTQSAIALTLVLLPYLTVSASAENWIEFYKEQWTQKSTKAKKKLAFSNCYYYDIDSQITRPSGIITLWVKEISATDRIIAKKGDLEKEALVRQVNLWCKLKRYEVIPGEASVVEVNEKMSDEIRSGTYYEKLHQTVCKNEL